MQIRTRRNNLNQVTRRAWSGTLTVSGRTTPAANNACDEQGQASDFA
jgi:hypothetical protein